MADAYDPAADLVHGHGWNSAAQWGGWEWRPPRGAEHYRTCPSCASIHPEDLATETPGTGTCTVCGAQGWEACFRKQPLGASRQEMDRLLADPVLSEDEKERLRSEHPAHTYSPGGWWASWADRKYGWPHKFYVEGVTNRRPEVLRIITALSPGQEDRMQRETGYQWYPIAEIPEGTDVSGWRLDDGHYTHVGLGSDQTHFVKFYTIHLAEPGLDPAVKDTIEHRSGLRFRFQDGGGVGWEPYAPPTPTGCACHWDKTDGIWSHKKIVPGCQWHGPA